MAGVACAATNVAIASASDRENRKPVEVPGGNAVGLSVHGEDGNPRDAAMACQPRPAIFRAWEWDEPCTFNQHEIARRQSLQGQRDRELRFAPQLVHQRPACARCDQDLAASGMAEPIGILAWLVELGAVMRVLDERNRQPLLQEPRNDLLDQRGLAAAGPTGESKMRIDAATLGHSPVRTGLGIPTSSAGSGRQPGARGDNLALPAQRCRSRRPPTRLTMTRMHLPATASTPAPDASSFIERVIADVPTSRVEATPDAAQSADRIAREAARNAAMVSASLALPPGPLGMLTVLPDLFVIWKIQRQLVADIFALHGRTVELTRTHMLYCLFRHMASQVLRDVVVRAGERAIVRHCRRKLSPILQTLGKSVAQRIAERP